MWWGEQYWYWFLFQLLLYHYKSAWPHYRPGVAQRVGRSIALLFHDHGTRSGWVVSSMPWLHFTSRQDLVPIVQEAGWAPGPVWTGGKSRPTGIRSRAIQPVVNIIIRVANNFKFFRTYISSLHLVRPLLPVGVEVLQRSLTMHNKPPLSLPELHQPLSGFSPCLLDYYSGPGNKSVAYFSLLSNLRLLFFTALTRTLRLDIEDLCFCVMENSVSM